jgi:hypothetical protein
LNPEELHRELIELARAVGFEVRQASGCAGADRDLPIASGVCQVNGSVWVILAATDSLAERSEVLTGALTAYASERLETRYLPPALREKLGV